MFAVRVLEGSWEGGEPDSVGAWNDYVDALGERGRELAAQVSALQAELVAVVAEAEATDKLGLPVTQWAAWQLGVTPGEARGLVGLAHKLARLPKLAGAFERGELSQGTVVSLAAAATPEIEDQMLELAEVAMAGQLQTMARLYRRLDDDDDGRPEPEERFSWFWDDENMLRLTGRLSPLAGAELEAALRAAKDCADRSDPDDHRRPEAERTTVSNPEALLRLAQHYLAGQTTADGVLPERFQVLVHLEAGDDDTLQAWLSGAGPVPQASITELLCEAWLTTVVTEQGKPVTTVRPQRFAQPDQVRALWVRDRMCRFPGCGRTSFLKAHHVRERRHGGPTSLDNLVLLCQRHHTLIHRPGWTLSYHPDTNQVSVTRPDGRAVAPIGRPPPPGDPPPTPGTRHTGTGERLTPWAKDVILSHWLN
jgi:hypothetical protein